MKKSDLKDGMVVEDRNNRLFMVVGDYLVGYDDWARLENFNQDLICGHNEKSSIIKVYSISEPMSFKQIEHYKYEILKLIWEREEINWSKVEVDTKVIAISSKKQKVLRHFAKYEEENIYLWDAGRTSFTAIDENDYRIWSNVKLYKEDNCK